MKVEACAGMAGAVQPKSVKNGDSAGEGQFAALFSQSIEKVMDASPYQMDGLVQMSSVGGASLEMEVHHRAGLWQMGTNTLDVLEKYQRKLADTSFPLEGLRPLVEELKEQHTDLLDSLKKASGVDGLTAVLQEVAALTAAEIEKYGTGN